MATKTAKVTAPKAPKTTAPKAPKIKIENALDNQLVKEYSALAQESRQDEILFIASTVGRLNAGTLSVRIGKASIKEAEKSGKAPTIRASHIEHFKTALQIINLEGADDKSLAEILKLATRADTAYGVEKAKVEIAKAKTYADADTATPTIAESASAKPKAGRKTKAKVQAPKTLEEKILAMVQLLATEKNLKDAKTSDLKSLKAVLGALSQVARNSEAKTA